MPGRLIFLLEEPSMKALLDGLLPRLFPEWRENEHFKCIKHEGKSDLDASIPRKLRSWQIPGDRFVIVRDNDNVDCVDLKRRYAALCRDCGRPETLIRLVCQELESWYLGDLVALSKAFGDPKLSSYKLKKRYVDPDQWQKPSQEVARIIPGFQKVSGARVMAMTLEESRNCSRSFRAFVNGVRRMADNSSHFG